MDPLPADPREDLLEALRGPELLAAICTQVQMLGRPPTDDAAENRLRELAEAWACSDEEVGQWRAYGQPTVIQALGVELVPDVGVTQATLAEETVHGRSLIGTARERSRVICSHLSTLVRAQCGLTDDQLVATLVEALLGIPLGSLVGLGDLSSLEGPDGDLLQAIKIEYEANDATLHLEDMEIEKAYSTESRSRLPAARVRERQAAAALATLHPPVAPASGPTRDRARARGAGRPRGVSSKGDASSGDDDSEGEPARPPASADDDDVEAIA